MYAEEDYLLLSGIQHFVFCKRQWALIHLEQQWQDNVWTVEGNILHERCHDETLQEKRGDMMVSRGMRVFSHSMGVTGACDVVEFHADAKGVPLAGREGLWRVVPVEYKRGKEKTHDADALQLCAQAMCLEEMLVCEISVGFLFYGEPKRRQKIEFTPERRAQVRESFLQMHMLAQKGHTPKVKTTPACRSCSLAEDCLPKLNKALSAVQYLKKHLQEEST